MSAFMTQGREELKAIPLARGACGSTLLSMGIPNAFVVEHISSHEYPHLVDS